MTVMDAITGMQRVEPTAGIDVAVPLVVDLDGTLVLTDTLYEAFIRLLFRDPRAALASLLRLVRGIAAFKRHVAELSIPDIETLPYRSDLVAVIRSERARGRKAYLVTASDQKVADAVAASTGLFDGAVGSDGRTNIKGDAKLARVRAAICSDFIYAGDSSADIPLFRAARGAILCDASRSTTATVEQSRTPIVARLHRPALTFKTWIRTFRIHQWSKNLLIFVPVFIGHALGDPSKVGTTAVGFALLCALASATYMMNDLADLEADRLHPTKRYRPFASGRLPVAFGIVTAPIVILAALAAAFLLSHRFAAALFAYFVLTTAYSFGLKRLPLLDVFVIGVLFTLRIVMGVEAAQLDHSPWLLSFAMAFFLSLALAKRHGEVLSAARVNVEEIVGRGYRGDDWPITLTFGVGTGLVSVLIMLLYMTNDAAPSGFYRQVGWLFAIPALVTLWQMRIWLLSHRLALHDDPVVFALRDRASLVLGLAVAIAFYLAL